MDVRIELSIDVTPSSPHDDVVPIVVRAATASDLPRLRAIAAVVHDNTRFVVDSRLRPKAGALYERWIERDVLSAGLALAAVCDEELVGYLTATAESGVGSISLVGVDEAARGHGTGRQLVVAALDWFYVEGCATATVVTSASALAAQRLYQTMGFRTSATGVWLHRWSDRVAAS
jgi:ribosomal protein S18 acetylase RimI-like enzyme